MALADLLASGRVPGTRGADAGIRVSSRSSSGLDGHLSPAPAARSRRSSRTRRRGGCARGLPGIDAGRIVAVDDAQMLFVIGESRGRGKKIRLDIQLYHGYHLSGPNFRSLNRSSAMFVRKNPICGLYLVLCYLLQKLAAPTYHSSSQIDEELLYLSLQQAAFRLVLPEVSCSTPPAILNASPHLSSPGVLHSTNVPVSNLSFSCLIHACFTQSSSRASDELTTSAP